MLPQSLWLLVLSYLSSIEARSSPQLRGVAFSNGTFTNASLSVVSSSIGSVSSAVPISTQTATATSISTSDTGKSTNSSIASQISASKILKSSAPTESPKTTRTLRNETVQTHAPCCFVIQDTISEEWWQRTSYISATNLVNLTSYTTYITERPGITATRVETNVYLTNASFAFTFLVGKDPISNLINSAPTPVEATQVLNATQIVTGGITMQSPSAFYVYNTVKIITAAPVTDARGHVYCATASTGAHGDVFRHINSNAEAYFGGLGIVGQSYAPISTSVTTETDTYTELYPITSVVTETNTWSEVFVSTQYTNSAGSVVVETSTPTGVVISLVTPFIYAPKRGTTTPGPFAHCIQDADTEAYGYVPKTLIDFLASDPQYSSQYPGLESCYGGGPSIIQAPMCYVPFETTTFQTAGGDITSATTIYVGGPILQDSTNMPNQPTNGPSGDVSVMSLPTTTAPPLTAPPGGQTPPTTSLFTVRPSPATLMQIIPSHSTDDTLPSSPTPPPITIQASTTIPISQAPAGAIGVSSDLSGTPVLVLGPTTIVPQSPEIVIPASTTIPVSEAPPGATGHLSTIAGTPVIILGPTTIPPQPATPEPVTIAAVTTIPLFQAPQGALGSTATIDGTPFLIIQPTTITPAPTIPFSTTFVSGTAFLVVPPTSIPISEAPVGLTGSTTTINGTPYLVITSSTSLPAPQAQITASGLEITTISGTPYIVVPSATEIPLSLAPAGLSGSMTTIDGTPYLEIGAATTIPFVGAGVTVEGGTTELVITAPTTMPVNPLFSVSGETTVIGGTTMVVLSSATTVVEVSSSSTFQSSSTGGSQRNPSTSSSKAGAAPTFGVQMLMSGLGAVAGGVVMAVL